MQHAISGPLGSGAAAYPWPAPRRGEFDELVLDGLVYAAPTGFRPLSMELRVPGSSVARPAPPTGTGPETVPVPAPVVVWVHGGGWNSGGRTRRSPNLQAHWVIERLVLAGFAVALVDYRHVPEAPLPAPVEDVRAAVRWLRAHAADLGLDGQRIVLWGESAGAHLACLAASLTDEQLDEQLDGSSGAGPTAREHTEHAAAVQALVDWYAPMDLPITPTAAENAESAKDAAPDPLAGSAWTAEQFSPLSWVHPGLPPTVVAHGRDDELVPVEQSRRYRDALQAAGVEVEYIETNGGHVFQGGPVLAVLERTVAFLRDRLDLPQAPRLDLQTAEVEDAMRATGRFPLFAIDDAAEARARGTEMRARFYPPRPQPVATVKDLTIPGPGGDIALRVQKPPVPSDVVVLYIHGGGWVLGDLDSHQGTAARLAAATPATVVQVDYRRAPEHVFPAAVDDAVAAAEWVHAHLADLGGRRLVLAGDSAGGNIAAAVALHCRDHEMPVEAVLLLYPATDWTVQPIGGLVASYVPAGQEPADPRLSPALAPSLAGLPPTILGVGGLDFLFEDNLAYVHALRGAGVPVSLRVFPELSHGFFSYATISAAADRASERMCRDLSTLLWGLAN
ncbi:alpha/beta hydrolase fold domain-containing protein [Kocuria sp. LHG3120]|uniref:alpha/beta hydrolase fold domain-containing protein n=1 Tax=Kocuria sp. LHG3120 TaxID=2804590 RepID=UPI003CFA2BBC